MNTWKTAVITAALLAFGVGVPAGAQAARANRPDTLHVGSVRLPGVYMREDSSEFIVVVPDSTAADGQRLVGRLSKRQRVIDRGTPMLFRLNHFSGRTNEVTDSVVTSGADLVPFSETSHQTSMLMHLKFEGRRVTGDVTPTGKVTEKIDQTLAVAPFNSSDVPLVIASLPLAQGYTALLATYEYESGGLRLDTLSVVGRESIKTNGTPHDAWVVRISRGQSSWMTFWLDAGSKHLLQQELASSARGWRMRIVRQ